MSGDSVTAVSSAHTCTTNSNVFSAATNNESGINCGYCLCSCSGEGCSE